MEGSNGAQNVGGSTAKPKWARTLRKELVNVGKEHCTGECTFKKGMTITVAKPGAGRAAKLAAKPPKVPTKPHSVKLNGKHFVRVGLKEGETVEQAIKRIEEKDGKNYILSGDAKGLYYYPNQRTRVYYAVMIEKLPPEAQASFEAIKSLKPDSPTEVLADQQKGKVNTTK